MKPIYEPRGAAKEYGDLALNIYTGCLFRNCRRRRDDEKAS